MLESKFCSFPAISLLAQVGVGVVGWRKLELKLTQPQVEVEAWDALGKQIFWSSEVHAPVEATLI